MATAILPQPGQSAAQQSAKAQLTNDLDAVGLGSLAAWAWNQYLTGSPEEQIFIDMRSRPEYKLRFPGMDALRAKGEAISEAQYVAYEQSATQLMHSYGVPIDVWGTHDMLGKYIGGQVSLAELGSRLQLASEAVQTTPQATRDALEQMYGVKHGDLISYFLDPKLSEPVLQQRFQAAQIGGAASDTGFGQINRSQGELLAAQGVSYQQALSGFGALSHNALATQGNLAGLENQNRVSTDTAIAGTFTHSGAAMDQLRNAEDAQKSAFGGGGVETTQQGAKGLAVSTTQ